VPLRSTGVPPPSTCRDRLSERTTTTATASASARLAPPMTTDISTTGYTPLHLPLYCRAFTFARRRRSSIIKRYSLAPAPSPDPVI
jgi:hypothetical protein